MVVGESPNSKRRITNVFSDSRNPLYNSTGSWEPIDPPVLLSQPKSFAQMGYAGSTDDGGAFRELEFLELWLPIAQPRFGLRIARRNLWLTLDGALGPFIFGQWTIPLLPWLSILFFIRFMHSQKPLRGFVILSLVIC